MVEIRPGEVSNGQQVCGGGGGGGVGGWRLMRGRGSAPPASEISP